MNEGTKGFWVHRDAALDELGQHAQHGLLDAVRERYGAASVNRANQLGRDQGLSVPLLPEHE